MVHASGVQAEFVTTAGNRSQPHVSDGPKKAGRSIATVLFIPKERMSPQILVVQMGARRGYELARIAEQGGALTALHTSAAWHRDEVLSRRVGRLLLGERAIDRRTVSDIPKKKLHATLVPEIVGSMLKLLPLANERRYRVEDWFLGCNVRWCGLGTANVLINTSGNGGRGLLRWARKKGLKIVTDIVITPSVYRILDDEVKRWPGWHNGDAYSVEHKLHQLCIASIVELSDLLLCPSEFVIEGLSTFQGFERAKVALVPYGLGAIVGGKGLPQPKRILFAGSEAIRKGLPYLAEAATMLRAADPAVEVRIAGGMSTQIRDRPECRDLNFLGPLSVRQMEEEFRLADVFCLPSLAEGMASVTIEALAYGVPCVVTRSAGAPISDGIEGLVVPERDATALASALRSIIERRAFRAKLSDGAIERAQDYSSARVRGRLISALEAIA